MAGLTLSIEVLFVEGCPLVKAFHCVWRVRLSIGAVAIPPEGAISGAVDVVSVLAAEQAEPAWRIGRVELAEGNGGGSGGVTGRAGVNCGTRIRISLLWNATISLASRFDFFVKTRPKLLPTKKLLPPFLRSCRRHLLMFSHRTLLTLLRASWSWYYVK